jgi:hypothetical protein
MHRSTRRRYLDQGDQGVGRERHLLGHVCPQRRGILDLLNHLLVGASLVFKVEQRGAAAVRAQLDLEEVRSG